MKASRWARRWGAFTLLAVACGGCGGNLTAGGFGEVEAYVQGDDVPAPAAPGEAHQDMPAALAQATDTPSSLAEATIVEGTVTVRLRLEVMDDRRTWTEITDGATTLTVPLVGGGPGTLLATRPLPPGRYVRSRVTFELVEADVVRGLVVDGVDLRGRVHVEFAAAAGREIQDALFVELAEGGTAGIVVALNSQLWLRLVNALLRRVPDAAFRQAVRVRIL